MTFPTQVVTQSTLLHEHVLSACMVHTACNQIAGLVCMVAPSCSCLLAIMISWFGYHNLGFRTDLVFL